MVTFSIAIPCRTDALPDAMLRLQASAPFASLDDTARHHAQLIIEELVTNAIDHGRLPATEHVQVTVAVDEQQLTIEMRDRGPEFDPTRHPAPDTSLELDERPIGGLGIYLAQTLADDIRYQREHGENRTLLCKRIGPRLS